MKMKMKMKKKEKEKEKENLMNLFDHLVFEDLLLVKDLDGNMKTSDLVLGMLHLCKVAFP